MPKISQSFSYTFKIGSDYTKIAIEVSDIDTELPLKLQMEKIDTTLNEVWKYILEKVDKEMEEVLERGKQ